MHVYAYPYTLLHNIMIYLFGLRAQEIAFHMAYINNSSNRIFIRTLCFIFCTPSFVLVFSLFLSHLSQMLLVDLSASAALVKLHVRCIYLAYIYNTEPIEHLIVAFYEHIRAIHTSLHRTHINRERYSYSPISHTKLIRILRGSGSACV